MWTIGLAKTGNEMGMNLDDLAKASPEEIQRRLDRAYERMAQTGAHYVVDSIEDTIPILDEINARLARGERP